MKYFIIFTLCFCLISCGTQPLNEEIKKLPIYKLGSYPMEYITASPKEEVISLIENSDTILVKYTPTHVELRQFYQEIDFENPNWSCQLNDLLEKRGMNLVLEYRYTNIINIFLKTISIRNKLKAGDEMIIANIYKNLVNLPFIASYEDEWTKCENLYFSAIQNTDRLNNINTCQLKEMQKTSNDINWIRERTNNIEYFFTQDMCIIAEKNELILNPKPYYRMRFEYEDKQLIPKLSLINPLALFSEAPHI